MAIEVFPGNRIDAQTVPSQVAKLHERFALEEVVLVADRGMVTRANLSSLGEAGIAWITALKAPQVQRLAAQGALPLSLFEQQNLAEISSSEYPGERLVVCRNPLVANERKRKREDLLVATESAIQPIVARVAAGTLRGRAEIGLALGAVINRFKMKKHFSVEIDDTRLAVSRKDEQLAQEAELDGIYILRTSVKPERCTSAEIVRSYKQLAGVERAFRTLKGILLCMLTYYVEWHLREAWKPLLFTDECKPMAVDPVAKATRSANAQRKASTQRSESGEVVYSFKSLMDELALRTRNTVRIGATNALFSRLTKPSPLQARALDLVVRLPIPL